MATDIDTDTDTDYWDDTEPRVRARPTLTGSGRGEPPTPTRRTDMLYAFEWSDRAPYGPTGRLVPVREVLLVDPGDHVWGRASTQRGLSRLLNRYRNLNLRVIAGEPVGPAVDPRTVDAEPVC